MAWHQETLQVAGVTAVPSTAGEAAVVALERRLGSAVPAALRSLLVTDAWPALLRRFSNGDHPLAVSEMGTPRSRWEGDDATAAGLLPFMHENQGVCTWALPLKGGDDPPVLVEVDSGEPPTWQTAAAAFSIWLRCQVEDRLVVERALFAAQAGPLEDGVRAELLRRFAPGPTTAAWPAREIIRLRSELGDVLLWNGDHQCDWWIAPRNAACAERMLEALPISPEEAEGVYELRPEGKPLLGPWRQRLRVP